MAIFSRQEALETSHRDIDQRWTIFWYAVFYVSLIITMGITLTTDSFTLQELLALCTLSLLLGIWYVVCVLLPPIYWRRHSLLALGYLLIGWVIWFFLAGLKETYFFVLIGLFPQMYLLLKVPWNICGSFMLLAIALWRHGSWDTVFFFTLGTGIVGMVLALFIHAILKQSRERACLIDELQATRQELAQAERQAGIMQERQRLAHEIHDTFTQGFSSIVMQIETLDATALASNTEVGQVLSRIGQTAHENLTEARRVLWALQPEALERASLSDTLISLAQRWTEENNISAHTVVTGIVAPLRPEIEVTLLRAAQEALANVRKHAQAHSITMTLSYIGDMVALDIQDDGIGFTLDRLHISPSDQPHGGFGLKALRERIELLGGTFSIESAPGEGTTIALTLPAIGRTMINSR
ncbi:sensor histidine kinase [Ktedonosporobacter rubrisoli]|uniref:Oxygen sensor histidine kinase NreB n=1 Tax=Ktedonosporobacter rubrisoli TaxID=2509675 RepID=A0A4P6JTK0_KTERU|nr:sensor histidine kinase [Ktedonosporobacter rubrisoli]QBD78774.1 sensor histidine kinase [Ktedonosporobacter rubrisoli]